MKKLPTWGKVTISFGFGVFLVIVIPVIINELYKKGEGYVTLWSAADVLSYYGMILAAVGAAAGVFFSLKHSQKQYEEDTRKRVLPYIAVSTLGRHIHSDLFDMDTAIREAGENDSGYYEYKLDSVYFVIWSNRIEAVKQLTPAQRELLEKDGKIWESHTKGVRSLVQKDYVSIPLEIENVGNGTALGFRVGLNKAQRRKEKLLLPRAMKQGQNMYIHVFSSEAIEQIKGKYFLELFYEDIYGTKYMQEYAVEVGINKDGKKYSSIDLLGKQEMTTEEPEDTNHADT